jgi:HAD superfamily hydrolase (TIGR01509 family)
MTPMTPDTLTIFSAVLLDIDGTLVDSNEQHVRAWAAAFRRLDYEIREQVIRKQIGKGGDQLIPSIVPGIGAEAASAISEAHDTIFRAQYLPSIRSFTDATELVARLHDAGLKVALASSAKRDEVEHYIRLLEIEELIDVATSADDVEKSKPSGDIFASALSKLGDVPPSRALVIGDTPYDVTAARKCGIGAIAVLSGGFDEGELMQAGAVEVYANVGAVLEAIGPARSGRRIGG